jgi:adenylate kinase family enzyme
VGGGVGGGGAVPPELAGVGRLVAACSRIAVVGSPGAGKSWLARRLGEALDLPVIHLDRLYWGPGWTRPEDDAWRATLARAVSGPRWIVDGNYAPTLDLRVAPAEAIVFLDHGPLACLLGVVHRRLANSGGTRPDMAASCPERLNPRLLRKILAFRRVTRPLVVDTLVRWPRLAVVLRRRGEVRAFATAVATAAASAAGAGVGASRLDRERDPAGLEFADDVLDGRLLHGDVDQ